MIKHTDKIVYEFFLFYNYYYYVPRTTFFPPFFPPTTLHNFSSIVFFHSSFPLFSSLLFCFIFSIPYSLSSHSHSCPHTSSPPFPILSRPILTPARTLHILPYTDSIDDVIKIHDPALHLHLNILGIRSGFLGWSLLKSLFSQILGDCNCDSCVIMGLDPLTKLRY